jgi:nuclear GTP-binding protein
LTLFSNNASSTAKQAKQLKIEKSGKAQRNAAGQITQAAAYQSRSIPDARIEPNRKWFSNSRVISQDSLAAFRQAMSEKKADPYSVLLRTNKLPLSLVETEKENGVEKHRAKMAIEASPFDTTFGPKSQRKRVKLDAGSFEDLARDVHQRLDSSIHTLDLDPNVGADDGLLSSAVEPIFKKGQSKRIWNELYRVIDSSDVLIQVLDARDPQGTRCESVEKYLRTESPHKHLIFVVNKVDLVPTRVAASRPLLFRPRSWTQTDLTAGILGEDIVEGTTNACAACQYATPFWQRQLNQHT